MNHRIVSVLISYIQNVKSKEDAGTAVLATMFYFCPDFTKSFFKEIGLNEEFQVDSFFDKDGDNFSIDTGYSITQFGLNFRPDVLICNNTENESFNEGDKVILIESKLWHELTGKQKINYPDFKKEIESRNGKCATFLFSIKYNQRLESFDYNLKWTEVLDKIRKPQDSKKDYDSEKMILNDLIPLLEENIFPSLEDFKGRNGKASPRRFLMTIINRLNFSFKPIPDSVINDWDYKKNELQKLKEMNIDGMDIISHFNYGADRYISCTVNKSNNLFVLFFEDPATVSSVIKHIGTIDTNRSRWHEDYLEIVGKISELIK